LTDGAPRFAGSPDAIDRAGATSGSDDGGPGRTADSQFDFAEDPLREEENLELDVPESVSSGPLPAPDLSGLEPTERQANVPVGTSDGGIGMGTRETFERDGVTYTRTTGQNGEVTTSYSIDGVNHSTTAREDGSSTNFVSESNDSGSHSRTVEIGPDGQFVSSQTVSSQGQTDPETGEYTSQNRTETINADLTRTTTEEVLRPDGGRSHLTRTEQPDGRADESYSYEGEQGTLNRSTTTAADGSSTTSTERGYQVDQPIENLVDGPDVPIMPPPPRTRGPQQEGRPLLGEFPADGREPTLVTEVEVTNTAPGGQPRTVHEATTYAQTSRDLAVVDESNSLPAGRGGRQPGNWPNATHPEGVTHNSEESGVTRSVTVGRTQDANGEWVDINESSQTVSVVGTRDSDGSEVRSTITHNWNAAGESTSSFRSEGYTRDEQVASGAYGAGPRVHVGGSAVSLRASSDGKLPDRHLRDKGGTEVEDFLGVDFDEPLTTQTDIVRNADGEIVTEVATLTTVDDAGNGRTVTRTKPEDGPVAWTYTDQSNGGRDYKRQTVFEGNNLSIYENHRDLGDGQFETTTETRNGDDVIGDSQVSRLAVDETRLRQYASDGDLTPGQLNQLLAEGPPYLVEHASNSNEQIDDQPSVDFESTTFSTGSGYQLGFTSNTEIAENGEGTRTTFNTVVDPDAAPPNAPFQGDLTRETRGSESDDFSVVEEGPLRISRDGVMTFNGEEIANGPPIADGRAEDLGSSDVAGYVSGAAGGLAGNLSTTLEIPPTGLRKDPLLQTIDHAGLSRLGNFADIVGAYGSVHQIWDGVAERDFRSTVEGVGGLATGGAAVAELTSAFASRNLAPNATSALASRASNVAKVLGPVGAVVGAGFGAWDLFTADSGYDRAAGALTIAAAGAAFIPVVGWAVSLGLGITAFIVGNGDANNTAGVDERLRE
jgi:hypothetical protein